MSLAALATALREAASAYLPADHARELAASLAYTLVYGEGSAEDAIAEALDARAVPRAGGGWVLGADVNREAIEDALLEAFQDSPTSCCATDCYGWRSEDCPDCCDDDDEPDNEADMFEPLGDYDDPEPCDDGALGGGW